MKFEAEIMLKEVEVKRDGVINQRSYNFNEF